MLDLLFLATTLGGFATKVPLVADELTDGQQRMLGIMLTAQMLRMMYKQKGTRGRTT